MATRPALPPREARGRDSAVEAPHLRLPTEGGGQQHDELDTAETTDEVLVAQSGDQPIGDFQMVQQMIADSATEIAMARLLVLNAAWETDQGLDPREKVSMVKVAAAETLGRVADRALQMYGGLGFCKDGPIERIYRDCRVLRIFDGTSEIHRGVIAPGLLKRGPAVLTPAG